MGNCVVLQHPGTRAGSGSANSGSPGVIMMPDI